MHSRLGRIARVLIGVSLIAGGVIGLLLAVSRLARLPGTPVAAPLPDVTLTALGGEAVTLADLRGRPLLINFWARGVRRAGRRCRRWSGSSGNGLSGGRQWW